MRDKLILFYRFYEKRIRSLLSKIKKYISKNQNLEKLLKISKKAEKALQAESRKSGQLTNIYNQSLNCLRYATEIFKLARYGQDINIQFVDKVLLRSLIESYVKISYMMKYDTKDTNEQERILKGMEREYLEKGKKIQEDRITFLNKTPTGMYSESDKKRLNSDLQKDCKKASRRIEEYKKDGINSAPEMYQMIDEIFEGNNDDERSTQSLFDMYRNCHPYIHCYPEQLNVTSHYNHTHIYMVYTHILYRLCNDIDLPEEDEKFLRNQLQQLLEKMDL